MANKKKTKEEVFNEKHNGFELIVKTEDVIKVYDYNYFQFINTKQGIIFKTKGGLSMLVKPYCQTLYGHLSMLLTNIDNKESLTPEIQQVLQNLIDVTSIDLQIPLTAFISDEYMVALAKTHMEYINKIAEEQLNMPLQEDDPSVLYKEQVDMEIKESLKKSADELD